MRGGRVLQVRCIGRDKSKQCGEQMGWSRALGRMPTGSSEASKRPSRVARGGLDAAAHALYFSSVVEGT